MDPASATIAVVGFAASLATLAGLVIESTKTINGLCSKFKRAPDDIKRFLVTLQQFEALLKLLKDRTSHYTDTELPQELKQFWLTSAFQMEEDCLKLDERCKYLRSCFDGKSFSNKHVRGRLQNFFRFEDTLELERRLLNHVEIFNLALSMVNE